MFNKQLANESFNQMLWKARRDTWLAKLMRKSTGLKSYEAVKNGHAWQKRPLSVTEIPTEKIVGTVERIDDFDGHFRPLKKHLRDRWVNVAVHGERASWPPIEVYKVGEEYFVIDGHHRTSFARNNGVAFIDAKVWEVQHTPQPEVQMAVAKTTPVIKHVPQPVCSPNIEESGAVAYGLCAC